MKTHRRLLRALVWCWLALFLPAAAHATPTDFTFRDLDLAAIFQAIAILGKFNIILDPQVRTKMTVTLKSVEPLDALFLIARMQELKVKRVKWEEGSTTTTYAIGREDKIVKGFEVANSRTIQLKYAKAEDVAGTLAKTLGKEASLSVEKDARTNRLLLKGTEEVLGKITDLVRDLDLPVPQVLIDSKVVEVQNTFTHDLGFDWSGGVGQVAPNAAKGSGTFQAVALTEYLRNQPNAGFYGSPGQASGTDFFKFGDFFRQNFFFNASLTALETKGLVRTLAAPRVLAIQGSQAQLNIGDKIVFSGGPSQPPEERDTGLILEITPRVNSDNFITMAIRVESSVARFDRPDFPTINRTTTKTEVQVRDGEEVLVGGLVSESLDDSSTVIPFLGDLPVIKHLFTHRRRNPKSRELVILVTPHVVKQNVASLAGSGTGESGNEAPPPTPPAGGGAGKGGDGGLGDLDLDGGGGPPVGGSPSAKPPSPGPSPSAGGGDLDLEGI